MAFRKFTLLTITLACLLVAFPLMAATGDDVSGEQPFGQSWHYLLADANTTLDQALTSNAWIKRTGIANFSFDGQPKWLHYRLPPSDEVRIFNIENPWLQDVDVYLVANGKLIESYKTGTSQPRSSRPIGGSGFAFGITNRITDVYVFDHATAASNFPVKLQSTRDYAQADSSLNAIHGMYYGILMMIILYSLAMFYTTKVDTYKFYSLYGLSLIFFLTVADGSGSLFLWPEHPQVNYIMLPIAWALALVFMAEFCTHFLGIQHTPQVKLLQRLFQSMVVVTALVIIVTQHVNALWMQTVVSAVYLIGIIGLAVYAIARKLPNGVIYLAANGVFTACAFAHIAMLLSWMPPGTVVQHAMHIGSIGELLILSIGLVRHIRGREHERFLAFTKSERLSRKNRELRAATVLAEEHRELQKSLQQAQKLKTIGQLAGGFAHDFNNILASILGFAELAKDQTASADRSTLMRYLSEIQSSGERGANLVKQLLVYSRSTASEPRNLDLNTTLVAAQDLLRGSLPATVSINTHLPSQSLKLHMDPEQLQQVLVNICINAAEAMRNRGNIDIYLENEQVANLSCASCLTRFSGEHLVIKLEDNGTGIVGNAEDLFTPFHTTKDVGQGTGLGLSVVHGIVHEHGGHIHASNRAEGGARFCIYLPPANTLAHASTPIESKHILLIEDDPSVSSYLDSLLSDKRFHTVFASKPAEALETFIANPDRFDLIITDYLMPQSTGVDVALEIHTLRPDLPIILTTGNANNLDQQDIARANIAGIFEKPLNSEQLLAKIHGLLVN